MMNALGGAYYARLTCHDWGACYAQCRKLYWMRGEPAVPVILISFVSSIVKAQSYVEHVMPNADIYASHMVILLWPMLI